MSAFLLIKMPIKRNKFIINSGASEYLINNKNILINYKIVINQEMTVANNYKIQIISIRLEQ